MISSSERSFDGLPRGWPDELWLRLAILSLVFALVKGFDANNSIYPVRPNEYLALQLVLVTATLLLAPRGRILSVYLPITWVCFMVWWLASYTWSVFPAGFYDVTRRDIGVVLTVVVLASIMPVGYFLRSIIHAGYVSIGLVFLAILLQPDVAFSTVEGGGLRGGFVHKNFMAASLCVTMAAVLAFWKRRESKWLFIAMVFVLIVLSQSSTGLATFFLVLMMWWALDQYGWVRRTLGRSFVTVTLGVALVLIVAFSLLLEPLVQLNGKDLTFAGRTEIWDAVITAIRQRPLIGYGWGGVFQSFSVEPTLSINRQLGYPVFHSHNAALELMLRLGAIGLVLFVAQLFATLRLGWKLLQEFNPIGTFIFLYGGIVVMFGFVESLTGLGVYFGLLVAFPAMRLQLLSKAGGENGSSRLTEGDRSEEVSSGRVHRPPSAVAERSASSSLRTEIDDRNDAWGPNLRRDDPRD